MSKCEQCIVRQFSSLKTLGKEELLKIVVVGHAAKHRHTVLLVLGHARRLETHPRSVNARFRLIELLSRTVEHRPHGIEHRPESVECSVFDSEPASEGNNSRPHRLERDARSVEQPP